MAVGLSSKFVLYTYIYMGGSSTLHGPAVKCQT